MVVGRIQNSLDLRIYVITSTFSNLFNYNIFYFRSILIYLNYFIIKTMVNYIQVCNIHFFFQNF